MGKNKGVILHVAKSLLCSAFRAVQVQALRDRRKDRMGTAGLPGTGCGRLGAREPLLAGSPRRAPALPEPGAASRPLCVMAAGGLLPSEVV